MEYTASSTKERFEELRKNPLVFGKYETRTVQDGKGGICQEGYWISCDSTIEFSIDGKNLHKNDSERKLFIIGTQILPNGRVDEEIREIDSVEFEIKEFNPNNIQDWCYVFNDCYTHYRYSGNNRHCHMILFWALYTMSWNKETIREALSQMSTEAAKIVNAYVSANILTLSLCKQNLLKEINPQIQPKIIPEIEAALNEISPNSDFTNFGFYQKVDYILGFGIKPGESEHLQKLYKTSLNGFIHFKYWMQNTGSKFYNYDFLEMVYSFVNSSTQLSIVKRYLHDVRLKLINIDFSLLERFRDISLFDERYKNVRYQAFVDIRYYVTNPGDAIDLVAQTFCDALLTLENTKGERIQSFNGILDFAVRRSNKSYPSINLGIKHFLPTCDGGLMPNQRFYGFIHYVVQHEFDESLLTEEKLKQTIDNLLDKYADRKFHYCCINDNERELDYEEVERCKKIVSATGKNWTSEITKSACGCLLWQPIKPSIWKKKVDSEQILSLFIDNVESKESITYEDVSVQKLKRSLLAWGKKYQSFSYVNGDIPENLKNKEVALHLVQQYYRPTTMDIYPNKGMFFSSRKSLLRAWDAGNLMDEWEKRKLAQRVEAPIVYKNTFEALKKMYPNGEVHESFIKLPYDIDELRKIKAYFYYRPHKYDFQKDYPEASFSCEFLAPKETFGVLYCTPKGAAFEKVSDLPFFWCRSNECFCNVLGEQTLDKQSDWRKYTLYHAAEIIGYGLLTITDKGNIPIETVLNFAGEAWQAEKLYARLVCRNCKHMIFSTRGSLLNGSRYFSCENSSCLQYRKEIYLSQCNTCKKGLIDSRDSQKCENGWVICPSCLACCNDSLYEKLITKHLKHGWIPPELLKRQGKGHNDKGLFYCPICASLLGESIIEKKLISGDGTEQILNITEYGCPQCKVSYEKELEKYKSCLKFQ